MIKTSFFDILTKVVLYLRRSLKVFFLVFSIFNVFHVLMKKQSKLFINFNINYSIKPLSELETLYTLIRVHVPSEHSAESKSFLSRKTA